MAADMLTLGRSLTVFLPRYMKTESHLILT